MKISNKTAGVILAFAVLVSCSTVKKDNAAIERVTAKRSLLNKVKPVVDSLWPCIIDTNKRLIPGRIDSIPYAVYVPIQLDSIAVEKSIAAIDTSKIFHKAYKLGYTAGFDDAKKALLNLKIPVHTPDTLLTSLINNRPLDIANKALATAEQELSAQQALAVSYKTDRNKAITIGSIVSAILLILLVGSNIAWLKSKSKLI
jgi:hypothetical protein